MTPSPRPDKSSGPLMITVPWPDGNTWRRWALSAALILIVLYLIYLVREMWVPLGLAFLLATVLDPVVDRMETRGWKRGPAALFIFGSFLIILVGLLWLATPYVIAQGADLRDKFNSYFPDTHSPKAILTSFRKMNAPDWLATAGVQAFQGAEQAFQRSSTWITTQGFSVLSNLIWLAIVPIVAFYALRDYHLILGKALMLVPRRKRDVVQSYVVEVGSIFAKYLRGLTIVSALNGIATWLLLWALHIPSSLVLGLVAGILYTVPYIGALITIVLTAAVSFFLGPDKLHSMLLAVGASVVLHQIIFDQIISPRILGGHVGLHPILAIVALLAGNILLGIVGMILAVPVAACIQIGVLAALPKLRVDIDLPDASAVTTTSEESPPLQDIRAANEGTVMADATEELHAGVKDAVDQAEKQVRLERIIQAAPPPAPEQKTSGE